MFFLTENRITPGALTEASQKLNEMIDTNDLILQKEVVEFVPTAVNHARELDYKSKQLEELLTVTRNLTGVRAASAYQDIATSIDQAKEFAADAMKAAENATLMVKSIFQQFYFFFFVQMNHFDSIND